MKKKQKKNPLDTLSNVIYRYWFIVIFIYAIGMIVFFSFQFNLLQNWDMIVRILNANYLFHNGFYFENQRALLESVVIGLFSYALGGYAVYAFLAVGTVLLFYALREFSKAFKINFLIVIFALFNPFTIMYVAKNGSEIFLIAFLILYISSIKRRQYYAGLFLALAFLSKYDALYFSPLLLFLLLNGKPIDSVKRILASIAIFLLALLPYFVYNLIEYGNAIYTFALTYLYYINVGNLPYFNSTGFAELLAPAVIALIVFAKRDLLLKISKKANKRWFDLALLLSASAIGFYTYIAANGFFLNNLGVYRFALLTASFLTLALVLFSDREDLYKFFIFSLISIVIAIFVLVHTMPASSSISVAATAKTLFASVYNTTNCTVMSNDWVYLDYVGLPASSILPESPYNGTPIVSLGTVNTSFPLLASHGNIYIYGYDYCTEHKVQDNFLTNENNILKSENKTLIPNNPCGWLFEDRIQSDMLYSICERITTR